MIPSQNSCADALEVDYFTNELSVVRFPIQTLSSQTILLIKNSKLDYFPNRPVSNDFPQNDSHKKCVKYLLLLIKKQLHIYCVSTSWLYSASSQRHLRGSEIIW